MTKERAKEILPVIQALADGGAVQYYSRIDSCWVDSTDPSFFDENQYRIKPSPKLRPWTQADAIPHLHDLFRFNNDDPIYRPIICGVNGISFMSLAGQIFLANWKYLFDHWQCALSASCEFKPCRVMDV